MSLKKYLDLLKSDHIEVFNKKRKDSSYKSIDFSGFDFREFKGFDFTRIDFKNCDLSNCRFDSINLRVASFVDADLTGCIFINCNLSQSYFQGKLNNVLIENCKIEEIGINKKYLTKEVQSQLSNYSISNRVVFN